MVEPTTLLVPLGTKLATELVKSAIRPFVEKRLEERFQLFVNEMAVSSVEEAEERLQENPERAYELLDRVRSAFTKEASPILARLLVDYRGKEPDAFYFQLAQLVPQLSLPELEFLRAVFHILARMEQPALARSGTDHPSALTSDVRSPNVQLPDDPFAVRVFGLLSQQAVVPTSGTKRLDRAAMARWDRLLNQERPPKPGWVTGEAASYWKAP